MRLQDFRDPREIRFASIIHDIDIKGEARGTKNVPCNAADEDEIDSAVGEQRQHFVELRAHRFFERRARWPASRKVAANELKLTSFSRRSAGVSLKFSRSSVRSTPGI